MPEDDDIHATVHAAAFTGEISCHRMILGESSSAQTIGSEAVSDDEEPHNFGCPGGGQFPVRWKLGSVNGSDVGVALDPHAIITLAEHAGDAVEGGLGSGLHLG